MRTVTHPGLATIGMFVLLLVLMTGCEGIKTSDRDISYVDPEAGMEAVREKKTLLGMGAMQKGVWVDPRGATEFEKGHIPGAINLPFQNVTDDHYLVRDYDVIVVYGKDYNDPKATGMSKKLLELGYKNVKTLRGGLRAWKESGNGLAEGPEDSMVNAAEE